jgi:hypothetical protein
MTSTIDILSSELDDILEEAYLAGFDTTDEQKQAAKAQILAALANAGYVSKERVEAEVNKYDWDDGKEGLLAALKSLSND